MAKRSDLICELYEYLHGQFDFDAYRREVVPPDVIFYKSVSTFLAVKLKTKWIDIEFFLDYYLDAPIVKKWLQTSKKRWVYVVSIDEISDINQELLDWGQYSYDLITHKKKRK
ncbi:MAG: hypothetical protein KJP00_08970 [Bacteroidia bacterium]|nr:hypothetical protein [Bacteroidia bacterium]